MHLMSLKKFFVSFLGAPRFLRKGLSFQCRSKSRCSYFKGNHNILICTHNNTSAAEETQQPGASAPPLNPEAESLVG